MPDNMIGDLLHKVIFQRAQISKIFFAHCLLAARTLLPVLNSGFIAADMDEFAVGKKFQ